MLLMQILIGAIVIGSIVDQLIYIKAQEKRVKEMYKYCKEHGLKYPRF